MKEGCRNRTMLKVNKITQQLIMIMKRIIIIIISALAIECQMCKAL